MKQRRILRWLWLVPMVAFLGLLIWAILSNTLGL